MITPTLHDTLDAAVAELALKQGALDRSVHFQTIAHDAVGPARTKVDEAVCLAAEGDHVAPARAARDLADKITIAELSDRAVAPKRAEFDVAAKSHWRAAWQVAYAEHQAAQVEIEATRDAIIENEIAKLTAAVESLKAKCTSALEKKWFADNAKAALGLPVGGAAGDPYIRDTVLDRALNRIAIALPIELKRAIAQ